MLATTLCEWDRAERHFELAMELNRSMGATTWLAHTAFEYARSILARPQVDRSRADAMLGQAAALAERIGMPALLARVRALGVGASPGSLPDGLSPREVGVRVRVAHGLSDRQIGMAVSGCRHVGAKH